MADFNWSWPTKIERDVIERALTLDFLPEARNLILMGTNGLGKTMIAQNICHAAVLAGHSVLFRSAAALLDELHRQTPEGRHRKLRTYANVDLLCVDEVGYLSFDDKSADLLYEVINRRYERKSVILTTNKPFKEWNEVFPNAACILTLLDRLLHHADVTAIEGDSYRKRESELDCVVCGKRMRAFNYRAYNLELDACLDDHGFWLDAGESDRVREVMADRVAGLQRAGQAEVDWDKAKRGDGPGFFGKLFGKK
jgi:Zn-finger nucleic acid-binding protein